ncbi:hypothetical protein GOODEAATRI_004891 [Goodea atripinnis]|uniref:Uncharacterized protein n=1 Tax=Goodea atripinnis TaxID=208336 RepID=A0ABV0P4E4_9TELE
MFASTGGWNDLPQSQVGSPQIRTELIMNQKQAQRLQQSDKPTCRCSLRPRNDQNQHPDRAEEPKLSEGPGAVLQWSEHPIRRRTELVEQEHQWSEGSRVWNL